MEPMCEMFESGFLIFRYDHPNVIAASGSIGLEILDQLPSIDAIILPIGGGGLIAGVATAIKQVKPGVLIYVTTSTYYLFIYLFRAIFDVCQEYEEICILWCFRE